VRLDGYIRVSKVGGRTGESFISPDDQRERIAAWATSRGVEIAEWHVDLDQSGGALSRPGLDALMARIRNRETQGVAVAYVDRLSRAGVADALTLVAEIAEHGGELAALDLGIDPTTPFGEFGMTVLLALGRMQRRRITEGWEAATGRAVARGVHAHAPFGYVKAGKGQPLQVVEREARVVRALFERRASGESWSALARWMDTHGIPPRRGTQWTRRAVETIVGNRAYLGEAYYGEHRNPTAHEALVGRDLFEAAQQARGRRPARGQPALLSGLVRCASCRHRLHAATVGERDQLVYRCKRRHGTGTCPAPVSVTRHLLDSYVESAFLAHYGDVEMSGQLTDESLERAVGGLADAEAELIAYRDNASARAALEVLGGDHFEQGLQARVTAVMEARETLERARRSAVGIDLGPATAIWPELSHAALLRNNADTGRSNAAITSAASQPRDQHFSNSRSPGVFQSIDKVEMRPLMRRALSDPAVTARHPPLPAVTGQRGQHSLDRVLP
jgi:site-specific DNA recombinase